MLWVSAKVPGPMVEVGKNILLARCGDNKDVKRVVTRGESVRERQRLDKLEQLS